MNLRMQGLLWVIMHIVMDSVPVALGCSYGASLVLCGELYQASPESSGDYHSFLCTDSNP